MNCDSCLEALDQFLDRELAEPAAREFELHVDGCSNCHAAVERKRKLRQALRAMPVTPPANGFYDRALEETVKSTQRNEIKFWTSAGLGTAIAASVIAWLVLALPVNNNEGVDPSQLAGVTISLNVEKTVRVSFESVRELPGATLRVQLPPGVEISGYGTRSEIRWGTTVQRGTNILELPIVVRSGAGGTILAQVEHGGKAKSFEFDVKVI